MVTPEDLQLTEKMRQAAASVPTYQSTTSWTVQGQPMHSACHRCEECHHVVALGRFTMNEEKMAQHLVTHHGYTLDGLSPEEMREACRDV